MASSTRGNGVEVEGAAAIPSRCASIFHTLVRSPVEESGRGRGKLGAPLGFLFQSAATSTGTSKRGVAETQLGCQPSTAAHAPPPPRPLICPPTAHIPHRHAPWRARDARRPAWGRYSTLAFSRSYPFLFPSSPPPPLDPFRPRSSSPPPVPSSRASSGWRSRRPTCVPTARTRSPLGTSWCGSSTR
jgi:hypothetical protein